MLSTQTFMVVLLRSVDFITTASRTHPFLLIPLPQSLYFTYHSITSFSPEKGKTKTKQVFLFPASLSGHPNHNPE